MPHDPKYVHWVVMLWALRVLIHAQQPCPCWPFSCRVTVCVRRLCFAELDRIVDEALACLPPASSDPATFKSAWRLFYVATATAHALHPTLFDPTHTGPVPSWHPKLSDLGEKIRIHSQREAPRPGIV